MSWYKDPEPLTEGYWGPITSTLLWCEEKYKWTKYIAEPANTLSNLFFIFVSLYGYFTSRREKLAFRFALCHLGVTLVGIGSTLFHGTLKYEMQLLDELPMIYTSAVLTYCVFETSKGYNKPRYPILLPGILIALVAFITLAYLKNGNPVFHQVAYASIQICSTIRVIYLLRTHFKASPSHRLKRKQIQSLYSFGAVIFLTGFAIWNIDNIWCGWLRGARKTIGYPYALILEGHAWWHLLTGYGAYALIVAGAYLVLSIKEGPDHFTLKGSFLPYVARTKPYKPNRKAN